jgi:iron complex outermembrane receptor protein
MLRFSILLFFLILMVSIAQPQDTLKTQKYDKKADSVHLLETVEVTAFLPGGSLRTIPGSFSVLPREDLQASDGTSLAHALNSVPGIHMQSGTLSTSRIVIRGMGSRTPYNTNRIRTYLNDIPLTSSDGVSTPEEVDLAGLDRIEIIRGPASALYGSGLGGNINLQTPLHPNNSLVAGLQYGGFSTAKAGLAGSFRQGHSYLNGSLSHLISNGYRENNLTRRTSMLAAALVEQPRWSIRVTMLLVDVYSQIPSSLGRTLFEKSPRSAAPNWLAAGGYEKYKKAVSGISLTNKLTNRLVNRLTLFGRWNDGYEKRPFNSLDDRTAGGGLRNRLSFRAGKTDWILGTELIFEQYDWKLDIDKVLINHNRESRLQSNFFGMVYYRPVRTVNISVAGALNKVNYQLHDRYAPNGDQSGIRRFPLIFSPRLGINWSPAELFSLYFSTGHGFSYPSPEETLLPEGEVNPEIRPEQGFQSELGTRLNLLGGILSMDLALYRIELKDLLTTKRITEDIFTGINAGRTLHQGLEIRVESRIFNRPAFPGSLVSTVSYSRSVNRFLHFSDDGITYDGNLLPGIPDQSMVLQLIWKPLTKMKVALDTGYTGKQFLADNNAETYPGYWLANLKWSFESDTKKAGRLTCFLGINNLTDTRYASMLVINARAAGSNEPRYFYPGLPRHVYFGLQYSIRGQGK